jgi:hypothetical protein
MIGAYMDFKTALASIATPSTPATTSADKVVDFTEAAKAPGFLALATTIQRLNLEGDTVRQFTFHDKPAYGFVGTRDWDNPETGEQTSSTTLVIALTGDKLSEAFNVRLREDGSFWAAKLGGKKGDPKSDAQRKLEEYVEQSILPLFGEDLLAAKKAGKVAKVSGTGSSLLSLFS